MKEIKAVYLPLSPSDDERQYYEVGKQGVTRIDTKENLHSEDTWFQVFRRVSNPAGTITLCSELNAKYVEEVLYI